MEKLKGFAREVFLFLSSRIFLKNFAMMLGVVVGFALFSNWFLGCYTNHGESVQVDDFIGMHVDDAIQQGKEKDFEFVIIDSSRYVKGKPSGIIEKQEPVPLSRVKEGRKIYVTVTGSPESYKLPSFSQLSYDYSKYADRLRINSIDSKVSERVFDKKQAEGTILYFYHNGNKVTERDVKAGYYVMPGDVLEFVVTEQTSNELQVPDLICMNYSAAEFLVSSSNLIIGTVNEDGAISNQSTAYVSRQEPAAGEPVQMGMQITVWIMQSLPDGCTETDTNAPEPSEGQDQQEEENW